MASKVGTEIRRARKRRRIGLRQLARAIEKSPSFLVSLETGDEPSASEATLRAIAEVLELDADKLITLAGKVPDDVMPSNALDVALFRQVKGMSKAQKREMLRKLSDE